MSVRERVTELAQKKGISVKKLEEELGLGRGSVHHWGESMPAADKLLKVADYFGVSVDYLLGREAAGQDPDRPDSYDEIRAELDALRRNPELRVLLSASADLTQEDIAFVTAMAKRMKGEE